MPRPQSTNITMRFITRMPDPLWRVWVQFKDIDLGQLYFSDKEHGGKEAALKSAIVYRDRMAHKHKIPFRTYAGNGFCVQHKNSTSGVVGVLLTVDNTDDIRRVNWTAKNEVGGKTRQLSRSIRKYGYAGAWRLVASFRQKHIGLPVPKKPPSPPDWLREWAAERNVALPEG